MAHTRISRRISKIDMMKVPPRKPEALIGCRHVQIFLMTCCFMSCYATRITMSVALVAMTDSTSINPEFEISAFDWDEYIQNLVLSSFFWGYVFTQVPAGAMVQRWGGHKLFGFAVGFCALVTLAIPVAAKYGDWYAICVCRVLVGLCQGVVPPVIHALLAKWAPTQERGRLTSFVYTGAWIGNVITLQSSGALSTSFIGWPACFYVWGTFAVLCSILWFIFGKESPADHPHIPLDEKEYIEISLGVTETTESFSTPWISMLTSTPVWALVVSQCCHTWGFAMLMTKIPSYMNAILNFDLKDNGLLSSIPYLAAWLFSFPVSFFADYIIRLKYVSLRTSRMIFNTIGELSPAVMLITLSYVGKEQRSLAVGVLILAVATNVSVFCGHHVNHMDLSPNFAGPMMGFANTAANICSIVAPLVVGLVVTDSHNSMQWRNIFFLTSGIYIMGTIAFLVFGSADVQSWNEPNHHKTETKHEELSETFSESTINGKQREETR